MDTDEAKGFFEGNFSHVYFILYDCFVSAETNLRQRGKNICYYIYIYIYILSFNNIYKCILHIIIIIFLFIKL